MALKLHSDLADSDLTNADMNFEADIKEAEIVYTALAEAERDYTLTGRSRGHRQLQQKTRNS